ncbi:MAG: 3-deoxy-D-manno-octulosonic acid transferase [Alphaproteobacteria bacterium GM7ARS4]|nr:3-deoxy-D-manno-octulosonic acid transferase [Alphaproteobacteria bacterium GM7ARS4]
MPLTRLLLLYRIVWSVAQWLSPLFLLYRLLKGKEDYPRLMERYGYGRTKRPKDTPLLWFHAASVGEYLSVLPLIESLGDDIPILLTTHTVTSAQLATQRNPRHVLHRYICLDAPSHVKRFLDYWRPSVALWVESELWPNLLIETRKRHIPIILLNARMSQQSHKRWMMFKKTSRYLMRCVDLCLAQNEEQASSFRSLGCHPVYCVGNIKEAAHPLPHNPHRLTLWKNALHKPQERPIWIAASTHQGEEQWVAHAHHMLTPSHPNLVTFLAPRHPNRTRHIAKSLEPDTRIFLHSQHTDPPPCAQDFIYIIDTVGMLGLFYRLAHVAFMGGSLIPHGGQNPLEAARLDCAIITGQHYHNFTKIYDLLAQEQAAHIITHGDQLGPYLQKTLATDTMNIMRTNAKRLVTRDTHHILQQYKNCILPWLDRGIDHGIDHDPTA